MEEKEEKSEEGKEEKKEGEIARSCPFWKGECRSDCMLYIAKMEKMTAKCAFTVIANQLEAETFSKTTPPGLGI